MSFFNLSRLFKSFRYALKGVVEVFKTEQNMRFHLLSALLVLILMFYFDTTGIEKAVLVLVIVLVLLSETINSVLERIVDVIRPRLSAEAKAIKDIMAAMVLVSAVGAVIVGLIIFVPKLFDKFSLL
ncbi:diacylglycerol kinase family protein [Patescibacteria group bacterium]|nr:diacylglycerol kinase family protein [Patescibacteria group bacterium]